MRSSSFNYSWNLIICRFLFKWKSIVFVNKKANVNVSNFLILKLNRFANNNYESYNGMFCLYDIFSFYSTEINRDKRHTRVHFGGNLPSWLDEITSRSMQSANYRLTKMNCKFNENNWIILNNQYDKLSYLFKVNWIFRSQSSFTHCSRDVFTLCKDIHLCLWIAIVYFLRKSTKNCKD